MNQPSTQPFPISRAGLIVVGDVIDFSRMDEDTQRKIVENIWPFLANDELLQAKQETVLNGTGDGALIAFPRTGEDVSCEEVIKFAQRWIEHMRESDPPCGLRIGIHEGTFQRMKVQIANDEQIMAIGTGANDCARISGLGGDGDIIVSEKFVESWANQFADVVERFYPRDDEPWEVYVKHGVSMRVRLYSPTGVANSPGKLKALEAVKLRVEELLKEIESAFVGMLQAIDASYTQDTVSARISILAPRPNSVNQLSPTDYRYHFRNESVHIGRTRYSIAEEGQGPAGRAFCSKELQFEIGLPEYIDGAGKTEYEERFKRNWSIKEDQVAKFQRKARSYICIPCGVARENVDVVLCFDMEHPLQGLHEDTVRMIGDAIQRRFGVTVAALWQLRVQ